MGSNLLSQKCRIISGLDSEIINLDSTEIFQCNLFFNCFINILILSLSVTDVYSINVANLFIDTIQ